MAFFSKVRKSQRSLKKAKNDKFGLKKAKLATLIEHFAKDCLAFS